MIDSREIIQDDCSDEQWREFDDKIEMLEPKELVDIADRLSLRIAADAHWTTYRDAFARETWWDFTEAYEHVMAMSY
jgi:hypothetical protein